MRFCKREKGLQSLMLRPMATWSVPPIPPIARAMSPETAYWSLQVVTQISALGTDSSGISTPTTTTYHYALTAIPSSQTPVSSCNPITGTGVPAQEADCVADNWSPGYNGTQAPQPDADWQDFYHAEYRGFNI